MPIVYGSQYYRPPEPSPDAWAQDLARMRETGLQLVKLWAMWGWMEPAEGRYRFEEFDRLFDLAHRVGLRVLPNLILECAPWWAQDRFPDGLWTSADGYRPRLQIRSNTPAGGWPGLCLNHPGVRGAAEAFTRAVVDRYAGHPALWGWDVWNEPSIEPAREPQWGLVERALFCYCPATVHAYRAWLQERHGSLDHLNAAWGRCYGDWSQVEPPRKPRTGYTDWIAWRLFSATNIAALLRWRAEEVKARDPAHPVVSHAGWPTILQKQPELRGADDWRMAEQVEIWGMSAYPIGPERWRESELDLGLDWTRRAARGRPFWLAEIQAGPHVKGARDAEPAPEDLERWCWRAIFSGASGVLYWQWRSQLSGYESPGYGLCGPDGGPTPRTAAASRMARQLRDLDGHLPGRIPKAEVAVLFTYEGYLHEWCRAGDSVLARASVLGAYELFWSRNIPVDPLRAEELEALAGATADAHRERGEGLPYKLLLLPAAFVMSTRVGAAVARYVENGGWVIAEAGLSTWTDDGWASTVVPGCGLHTVFGVREIRVDPGDLWRANAQRPVSAGFEGTGWRAALDLSEEADVLGTFEDGTPALVGHRYGRGYAVYIPTLVMGRAAAADGSAARLITALAAEAGVTAPVTAQGDARARLMECEDRLLLLVWGPPQHPVTIEVPAQRFPRMAFSHAAGATGGAPPPPVGLRARTLDGEEIAVVRRREALVLAVPLSRGVAVVEVK